MLHSCTENLMLVSGQQVLSSSCKGNMNNAFNHVIMVEKKTRLMNSMANEMDQELGIHYITVLMANLLLSMFTNMFIIIMPILWDAAMHIFRQIPFHSKRTGTIRPIFFLYTEDICVWEQNMLLKVELIGTTLLLWIALWSMLPVMNLFLVPSALCSLLFAIHIYTQWTLHTWCSLHTNMDALKIRSSTIIANYLFINYCSYYCNCCFGVHKNCFCCNIMLVDLYLPFALTSDNPHVSLTMPAFDSMDFLEYPSCHIWW